MNLELASIKGPRASQEIAQQLRDAIYSGHLLPGDKLPSERELVRQFESSRVTVREAIRSLEMAGLLSVKRGYGGGAFVADVDLRPLKESFSTLLRLRKVTIAHLTEVRLLLEPHLAALAARRV
ncbi:MAG: FadR family transcriptional regulator, partial [Candidatus Rokubacteria bacterium]|nr:FadR family transcriptional regulator [Candidatus Rokubacteria bacterium]